MDKTFTKNPEKKTPVLYSYYYLLPTMLKTHKFYAQMQKVLCTREDQNAIKEQIWVKVK